MTLEQYRTFYRILTDAIWKQWTPDCFSKSIKAQDLLSALRDYNPEWMDIIEDEIDDDKRMNSTIS